MRITAAGGVWMGKVVLVSPAAIDLTLDVGTRSVAMKDIGKIEVPGHFASRGALVGGLIGVALGLVSTAGCRGLVCGHPFTAFVTALFGGIGAGAGALIGRSVPRWQIIYPPRR